MHDAGTRNLFKMLNAKPDSNLDLLRDRPQETGPACAPIAPVNGGSNLTTHIAIIMDGNGRWAKARYLPRAAGHHQGAEAVRATVRACGELGIRYLTLFAFSSDNWKRPGIKLII